MNTEKFIKFLYGIFINTLGFIFLSVVSKFFLGYGLTNELFVISSIYILFFNIIQFSKGKIIRADYINKVIGLVIIILVVSRYSSMQGIIYGLYIFIIVLLQFKMEDSSIYYDNILSLSKVMLVVCSATAVITIFGGKDFYNDLFKYYLMILVLMIILLRETRTFINNIDDSKVKKINWGIIIVIFSVASNKGEEIFNFCLDKFNSFLSFLYLIFAKIMYFFLKDFLAEFKVLKPAVKEHNKGDILKIRKSNLQEYYEEKGKYIYESKEELFANESFILVFKVLFIIILGLVMYIVLKKLIVEGRNESNEEIVEKIEKMKPQKRKAVKNKIIKRNLSVKEKIFYAYRKFLTRAYSKELFKKSMTATQIEDKALQHVNMPKELKEITNIYNKAKFSNENIKAEDLEVIKENVKKVHNEL